MDEYIYVITDGLCKTHIHGKWMKRGCPKGFRVVAVYKA